MVKKELTEGIEFIENLEWTDYLICRLKNTFLDLTKTYFLLTSTLNLTTQQKFRQPRSLSAVKMSLKKWRKPLTICGRREK